MPFCNVNSFRILIILHNLWLIIRVSRYRRSIINMYYNNYNIQTRTALGITRKYVIPREKHSKFVYNMITKKQQSWRTEMSLQWTPEWTRYFTVTGSQRVSGRYASTRLAGLPTVFPPVWTKWQIIIKRTAHVVVQRWNMFIVLHLKNTLTTV